MKFASLFPKVMLSRRDAEVIFDRDEPIGAATDLVMPRRRWFRQPKPNSLEAVVRHAALEAGKRVS